MLFPQLANIYERFILCFILIYFVVRMFTLCVFLNTIYFMGLLDFGHSRKHLRILDGQDANESDYPYIALMSSDFNDEQVMFCTCTIITSEWSLTAAHCINTHNDLENMLGEDEVDALVRYGKPIYDDAYSYVTQLLAHPNFKLNQNKEEFLISNDIGLLKTDPIKLSEYGQISALDYGTFIGQEVHVFGYGLINDSHTAYDLHKPLQVLVAMVQKCDTEIFDGVYPVICLAHRCGAASRIDQGDSGGPTIHYSGVIAVTSSFEEMEWYHAGRMTPVSPYLDWIYATISKKDVKD